jgi:hypothetical protein
MTRASSERDHSSLANCRHRISRQVKSDPAGEQRDLQRKLRVAIIPQTKADLPSVVVDREIARVRNEIENPVRENCQADDQRRRLTVVAAVSAADRLINEARR